MKSCDSTVVFGSFSPGENWALQKKAQASSLFFLNGTLTPKKGRIYIFKKSRAKKYCITKQTLTKEEKKLAPLLALRWRISP